MDYSPTDRVRHHLRLAINASKGFFYQAETYLIGTFGRHFCEDEVTCRTASPNFVYF